MKKFFLGFVVLAVAAAIAGNVKKSDTYTIKLFQPSIVLGTELKAGDYKLVVALDKITFTDSKGNQTPTYTVKVESAEKKFDNTAVRFRTEGGKYTVAEIRLGGTTTRLVLNP